MGAIPGHIKPVLKKLIDDRGGELLTFYAEKEATNVKLARGLADATGVDTSRVPAVNVEQRSDELGAGLLALIEGRFPQFYAEKYLRTFADAGADKAPEVGAGYADMSAAGWRKQKERWAEGWREQGLEGTDDELAAAHVATRFGMELDAFENVVVRWPDDAHADRLEEFFGGTPFGNEPYLFVGLTTAEGVLRSVNEQL